MLLATLPLESLLMKEVPTDTLHFCEFKFFCISDTSFRAFMMVPNVYFPAFGKILFALTDILIGVLLQLILQLNKGYSVSSKQCFVFVATWLFNPIVINVSTRYSLQRTNTQLRKRKCWISSCCIGVDIGLSAHDKEDCVRKYRVRVWRFQVWFL
jgi:hypothetical protein